MTLPSLARPMKVIRCKRKGILRNSCARSPTCARAQNLFGCVFRVRSRLAFAIHQFFQERGFYYIHTPIITGSDCEESRRNFYPCDRY